MDKELEKRARINQYRDWLIPSIIFTGISASVFIYIISTPLLTTALIVSASLSILSIFLFILSYLYAVTRIEAIEYLEREADIGESLLFILVILGVLAFLGSLSILSFWKSITLGIVVTGIILLGIIAFLVMMEYESKLK